MINDAKFRSALSADIFEIMDFEKYGKTGRW